MEHYYNYLKFYVKFLSAIGMGFMGYCDRWIIIISEILCHVLLHELLIRLDKVKIRQVG